jgi:hypothetical protein
MLKKLLMVWYLLVSAFGVESVSAEGTTVAFMDFEQGSLVSGSGWSFGSMAGGSLSLSTDKEKNFAGSNGSLKATYPLALGNIYAWARYDIASLNTRDVYVEFDAKIPASIQGVKFLKVFGRWAKIEGANSYANATFGLDYSSVPRGNMCAISYGDGTDLQNDTQVIISFDRDRQIFQSRTDKTKLAEIMLPERRCWAQEDWGNKWHHFKYHVKFNSGTTKENEVADGEFYVEIDGKVYVNASKLFNRHFTNEPIGTITFFDWAQNGTAPFEVWLDNIRITTGGFVSPVPKPPNIN